MKRISKELAEKELKTLPKQEFRINITLKTECGETLTIESVKRWLSNHLNGSDVGAVEIRCIEEHLNRSLNPNEFSDEELYQALKNNDCLYYGETRIKQAIATKQINIYWSADREKILAYL